MKAYFSLQYRMINRKLVALGFAPWVAYLLLGATFIFLSFSLFSKTDFAEYIYIGIALALSSPLNEPQRNEFLQSIFKKQDYLKLRILENNFISLPFGAFLMYEQFYLSTVILLITSSLLALFNFKSPIHFTIPTPFGKRPFEFAVGFRNTFYLFPIAYGLTAIAIWVNNFNLGIFALALICFISWFYYTKLENDYFIWNFSLSSKAFLMRKIKTACLYSTLLILPIIIALGLFFFEHILILIAVFLLSYIYLANIILAKYSAYPHEMNILQGLFIIISVIFPPFLIVSIPLFYSQSIKSLKPILND